MEFFFYWKILLDHSLCSQYCREVCSELIVIECLYEFSYFLWIFLIFVIYVVEELIPELDEIHLSVPSLVECIIEYTLGECVDRIEHHGPIRDGEEEIP